MREPNRIAFAGDWHANTHWAVRTIHTLCEAGVDTIVHTGDFGYTFSDSFVGPVNKALKSTGIDLYFVDGNHDDHPWIWSHPKNAEGNYKITNQIFAIPRGHRWEWWGLTFMGLGGAHSVDADYRRKQRLHWWPTEWITDEELEYAGREGDVDVVIAHDVPAGVPVPGISFENGLKFFSMQELLSAEQHRQRISAALYDLQPKYWIHGHYHVDYRLTNYDGTTYVGLNMDNSGIERNIWVVDNRFELSRELEDA